MLSLNFHAPRAVIASSYTALAHQVIVESPGVCKIPARGAIIALNLISTMEARNGSSHKS